MGQAHEYYYHQIQDYRESIAIYQLFKDLKKLRLRYFTISILIDGCDELVNFLLGHLSVPA